MKILRVAMAFSAAAVVFAIALICCTVIVFDLFPEVGRAAIDAAKKSRQG